MSRDYIDGQRTVSMDGREFAVVAGRRWTRIHEYLCNGQLTARWFVDEVTSEVREADSARKPKSWPMGATNADYVLRVLRAPEATGA